MRIRALELALPCYAPDGPSGGSAEPSGGASAPSGEGGGASPSPPSSSPSGATPSDGGQSRTSPSSEPGGGEAHQPPPASPSPGVDPFADFAGMGEPAIDPFDEPAPPAEPPPAEPKPQEPPAQAAPATPAPATAAAPAAAEPPAAAPPTGPQEPLSLAEPERIGQALAANFDTLVQHLAQNQFKLSEQDLQALETDAPAHIPTLLARVYLQTQQNMYQQLGRVIPHMVSKQMQTLKRNMENEGAFYGAWPSLDRTKHGAIVQRAAVMYRQMNPQASREQMIKDLGPIVMQAAGVPLTAMSNGQQPPQVPQTRVPQPPFRPALPGSVGSPPSVPDSEWAGLGAPPPDEN